jgi:hypothetical protein
VLAAMQPHDLLAMDGCDITVNINTAIISAATTTTTTTTNVELLQSTPSG